MFGRVMLQARSRVFMLRFLNEMPVIRGNGALEETVASKANIYCVVDCKRKLERRASACPAEVALDIAAVYG